MRKLLWLAVLMAILAAFFASASPDGLGFIAEKFSFANKEQAHVVLMPKYNLFFLPNGGLTTALAGVAGVLIVLTGFWLTVYLLIKGKK